MRNTGIHKLWSVLYQIQYKPHLQALMVLHDLLIDDNMES